MVRGSINEIDLDEETCDDTLSSPARPIALEPPDSILSLETIEILFICDPLSLEIDLNTDRLFRGHRVQLTLLDDRSYRAALKAACSARWQICVVGQSFAGMSGTQLIREAIRSGATASFVLLFDYDYAGLDSIARSVGATDYLVRNEFSESLFMRSVRYTLDRRSGEEDINDSLKLLYTALDSLGANIAIIDTDGYIIAVNSLWRSFAEENEMNCIAAGVGSNYLDVCDAASRDGDKDAKAAAEGIRAVLSGVASEFQYEYRADSPTERQWFMMSVHSFDRETTGQAVITHRNITKRKLAEESIREGELRYRDLFENAEDVMFTHDLDGRFTSINRRAIEFTGYAEEELLNTKVSQLLTPESWQVAFQSLSLKFAGGSNLVPIQVDLVCKDGLRIPLEITSRLIRQNGQPFGIQCVGRDIRERRRSEEALRRSEQRFHALIEHASDLVAILSESGALLYASPSMKKMLGFTPEEWIGRNILTLIHPDDSSAVMEALHLGKVGRDAGTPLQFRIRHKDESWRTLEATDTNLLDDEAVRGIVVNARDITERLRLEDQLRQSQRMEAVGRLAGGVAHDFNNLLTAISGYSDLILRRLTTDNPLRREVEEVMKAAERASSLTRQLLAFSRKQVLQPRVLDLNNIVNEMDKMLRRLIGEDIELITNLTPSLFNVKADPGQIEQVIMNLAVNARDAMPNGGKLIIETENVELDTGRARRHTGFLPGLYVMLAVSDNGCGMDKETQSKIFEPFFTTKEFGRGTGLGLSTAYGIIKQSGGDVKVYSEPGIGTSFKIYLPCVYEPAEIRVTARSPYDVPRGNETVLLVEDDDGVRMLAREILQMSGYSVLEACHGSQALEICESHKQQISILVTDVVMPQMSGRELSEKLLQLRPQMKLLFMSGYTDDAILHHGVLDSNLPFLQKPFTPHSFVKKVREVLDR